MSRADDPVVAGARDGDEDAWRELYLTHARRLVVWLRATPSLYSATAAEDIAAADVGAELLSRDPAPDVQVVEEDSIRELLAHLSPREAEVIACIDAVGMDVAATSRALGMSPSAVRVARFRGLGRLRGVLGDPVRQAPTPQAR